MKAELCDASIEPTLIQPTFVTHLPKELVPLAKLSPDDPTTVEVFECCIKGAGDRARGHVASRRAAWASTAGAGLLLGHESIRDAIFFS